MTLDNEDQRKNLLAMVNNISFKGESAREIVKLIEALEGAEVDGCVVKDCEVVDE